MATARRGVRVAVRAWMAGVVAVLAVGTASGQPLAPREELKSSLDRPDPDAEYELVVKFRDSAQVRPLGGGMQSLSGANLDALRDVLVSNRARLKPRFQIPEAILVRIERRAAAKSGVAQPDLRGIFVVHARDDALLAVARDLERLDIVEFVSFSEVGPPPPCGDASPTTPSYHTEQSYHGPDPGLNMTAAWGLGDTRGDGVRIALCEYGFNESHESLCGVTTEPGQTIHPSTVGSDREDHGTAVLGVLVGNDASYGVRGLVPDADASFFPERSTQVGYRRADAIAQAIASTNAGDVVVLEMQHTGAGGGLGPAELDPVVWTLTKLATDSGIVVVAAAGNGAQDLDSVDYEPYRDRGDSGAILVGAATPDHRHARLAHSTHGSRVNLRGWGGNVFTAGYGTHAEHGGDANQRYTASFNQTSAATPMVAAAAVALQSFAEARLGRPLEPLELRDLLVQTGVAQKSGKPIGPLPDVYAAAMAMEIPCPEDVDRSGAVDSADLTAVVGAWGQVGGVEDVDRSGGVDMSDGWAVIDGWGGCP